MDPILLVPIEKLELGDLITMQLKGLGLNVFGDLVQMSEVELFNNIEFQKDHLFKIKDNLASRGLSLGLKINNWPPKNIPSYESFEGS